MRHSNIEQLSREEELSREIVQSIFNNVEKSKKREWGNPKKVGIDEFAERKGHKNFVTVVSDIDNGKPLEIIEGREGDNLIEVLFEEELEAREGVEEVSVDTWAGFVKVIEGDISKCKNSL